MIGAKTTVLFALAAAAVLAAMPVFADAPSEAATADAPGRDLNDELLNAWKSETVEQIEGIPMEDLSFPIDHFEDGTVKAQFSAKWALVPDDEKAFVRAKGVYMELYDETGAVIGIYVAQNCIFDRTTRVGYCEGPVRMEYKAPNRTIRLDGEDMQWNLATRNAKILSKPVLVMDEIMGELGGAFK